MTIRFMKFIDEYVGKVLVLFVFITILFRKAKRTQDVRRILIIKFWGIGSVTLSTPLLVELKKRWPRAKIHFLTLSSNSDLCRLVGQVDFIHAVSLDSVRSFVSSATRTMKAFRRQQFDIVYDLEFFTNISAIFSALSGSKERVGFINDRRRGDVRKLLYSRRVQFQEKIHTANNFLQLADMQTEIHFPKLSSGESFEAATSCVFPVTFNINAGPLAYERRWMREEFRQLADHLVREFHAHIFLIGSKEEKKYVGEFATSLENKTYVTDLSGKTTIGELVNLVSSSRLVVTNDSGPLHIASALNIPTISFFGPETPLRYGSLADRQLTFYRRLWCSPCMTISNLKTVDCINDRQCMRQIRFIEIKESVDKFVRSFLKIGEEAVEEKVSFEV